MPDQIPTFILASGSPRRSQLLHEAGFSFEVVKKPIDESYDPNMLPLEVVDFLARHKIGEFSDYVDQNMVLTADTIVHKDDLILGKPLDREHSIKMLKFLSGKDHLVSTSVCLGYRELRHQFTVTTRVFFSLLTDKEIEYYADQYLPFDKAGAYGIQEWIGHIGISRIEGSYTNVVGLPMNETYHALNKCIELWLKK